MTGPLAGFLPPGTTWLDLATLAIAIAALALTVRRDRALGKVGVSMRATVVGDKLVVGLTNTERRTVSIEAAGVASHRSKGGFEGWSVLRGIRQPLTALRKARPPREPAAACDCPSPCLPETPRYVLGSPLASGPM